MVTAVSTTPTAALVSPGPILACSASSIFCDQLSTVIRLVYLPVNPSQSPRIFSFPLNTNASPISIGSHSDAHVRVTTANICPHQCSISLSSSEAAGTPPVIDIKNTGQSLFQVNSSTVSPDSPPLQLCSGDLLVLGANQDRKFRIEIVHSSSVAASTTPTQSPSSLISLLPATPSHSRPPLPPGIAATPASIRRPPNALPRTPSTTHSLSSLLTSSSTHPHQVHGRPLPVSLTQPRPALPASASKSVKWGPPLRPQLFLASDPPSSPVARGATPPVQSADDASSSGGTESAAASSPLAGMTPRSILKKRAAAAKGRLLKSQMVNAFIRGPSGSGSSSGMASLLSPKSTGPLRGSSFKFSAPVTGSPPSSASSSSSSSGAAAFAARASRPATPSPSSTFTSDASESELSDFPSSPSPAAPPKSKDAAASAAAETKDVALTPTKSSNRSSLSSHLPATASPTTQPVAAAASPIDGPPAAPESVSHAASPPSPTTPMRAHVDQAVTQSPHSKRDVELVMVSDSEGDMSLVSVAGDAEAEVPPPKAVMATSSPLAPAPSMRNENASPSVHSAPGSSPKLTVDTPTRTRASSPALRTYVRPATAPVLAAGSPLAVSTPARKPAKRARSMVDEDSGDDDDDDDGAQATPSKKAKVDGGGRRTKIAVDYAVAGEAEPPALRRSLRVRTPVKRLGTF